MRVNLTIFRKGLIIVAVPLLFQAVFIGVVAVLEAGNAEASKWSLHTKEVLGQAEIVLTRLLNAETGLRGYMLTGDPIFAEPYDSAAHELPAALEHHSGFPTA